MCKLSFEYTQAENVTVMECKISQKKKELHQPVNYADTLLYLLALVQGFCHKTQELPRCKAFSRAVLGKKAATKPVKHLNSLRIQLQPRLPDRISRLRGAGPPHVNSDAAPAILDYI